MCFLPNSIINIHSYRVLSGVLVHDGKLKEPDETYDVDREIFE